jgi:hypothetical protein
MFISKATSEDHLELTELTIRSKAHWDYSKEHINEWLLELTITADYIDKNEVFKLVKDNRIVAYYSYCHSNNYEVLLDNLFVSPKFIRKRLERKLLLDFLDRVKSKGVMQVLLYSDPNSEGFY